MSPPRNVIAEGRRIPFDYLIVATGAEHAYFGNDWASYAPGLKTIDDATYLRRRILLAFERAESEPDADERSRLLNFVVVGGGPTGVEMAGAIAELAKRALASDFRSIDPRCARVILIEAGPRLLAPFDPALSEAARHSLEQLGVEVRLGAGVTDCDCSGVSIGAERIETRTIIWAAGVKASPAAEWLGVASDRAGRVKVQADLSVPGHPDIFVIGDVASRARSRRQAVAGRGARREAARRNMSRRLLMARANGKTLPPFRYRDAGSLATIGRKRAVAQIGPVQAFGIRRVAAVERRAHLLPDRLSQPPGRRDELVLELRHLSARHPPDHRACPARASRTSCRSDDGTADGRWPRILRRSSSVQPCSELEPRLTRSHSHGSFDWRCSGTPQGQSAILRIADVCCRPSGAPG